MCCSGLCFFRNFLLRKCVRKSNSIRGKTEKRISPYRLCVSVVFLRLFLKQLRFTALLVLWVGVFWLCGLILQTRARIHVHTPSFPSKDFIWTLTWKRQRSRGWAAFCNLINSYWRAESAARAIPTLNPFFFFWWYWYSFLRSDSLCACQHCAG